MKVTNAFVEGSSVVLLARENGRRTFHNVPAEHVAYFDALDIDASFERQLRNSIYVKSLKKDDNDWVRVGFVNDPARSDFCTHRNSPIKQMGIRTYEGDVDPVVRYVIDNNVEIAKPRRVYFDLETDSRVPFSQKEEMRILAWALVDEEGNSQIGVLSEDTERAEKQLLDRLWDALEPYDQVCAWNGDNFDFPVLFARSRARGCAVNAAKWLWLDHLTLFRRMNLNAAESGDEKQSMKLNDIAQAVVGEGKEITPPEVIEKFGDKSLGALAWALWEAGGEFRRILARYNLKDTVLLHRIEQETGYIALFDTLCEACHIFPDSRGINPTHQMDGFMLHLGLQRGYHFPTKHYRQTIEQFKGAYVMDPQANGILRNVHVCDFASLYPSIILTWNMSPETKVPVPPQGPLAPNTCRSPLTGIGFATDQEGILPVALKELLRLRKHWNDLKASCAPGTPEWHEANRKSTAFKTAANSFYGIVGSPFSRFFDPRIAESVTQNGKWLLLETMKAAEERGMKAIYGDSITEDRTVVLQRPNGNVCIRPIKEFWEMAELPKFTRGKEFRQLFGWKALARDKHGVEGWFPLTALIRHKVSKDIWRLSSKRGQVEVTADHSLMVANKKVTPKEFVENGLWFDSVEAPQSISNAQIDLFEHVKDFTHTRSFKGRKLVRRFETWPKHMALNGWGTIETFVPRFYNPGTEQFHALLRVLGAYLSEGSSSLPGTTTFTRYMLSFSQNKEWWIDSLAKDLQYVLGCEKLTKVWDKSWNGWHLRSGTASGSCLFAALCSVKSTGKRLPEFAYNLNKQDWEVLWNALLDGDGHREEHGQVSYTTQSSVLTAGISFCLNQHGVEHAIHYREEKKTWTIRTRPKNKERIRSKLSVRVRLSKNEWVYDLSVEGAHTFVDGIGRVLLHNTDSAFIMNVSEEDFRAFTKWCNAELYPNILPEQGCVENHIKLEYEKAFDRIVFCTAKRYIGAYSHFKGKKATSESKPEIKGLEYKRGDALLLARKLQTQVIDLLVGGMKVIENVQTPTEELEHFHGVISTMRSYVLESPLPLEQVKIAKALSKPLKDYAIKVKKNGSAGSQPPHVQIGKVLASRGEEVGEGTRVEYIVIDGAASPMKVAPASDYTGSEADRYYLWENLIYPPSQRLLEAAFPTHNWDEWLNVRPPKPKKERKKKSTQLTA